MSAITNAYDYFTPIEDAIAAVFVANEIVTHTPLGRQPEGDGMATDDGADDKRPRPRVELSLQPGASLGMLHPQTGRNAKSGHCRERARRATLNISVVTQYNVAEHRAFLCLVLSILDTIGYEVNNTRQLENHNLQSVRVNGGTTSYNPEDGALETELSADVDFSTQTYALTALE